MSQEVVEASAARLHLALQGRNERVGCAESLTGGELAAWLSSTPGASSTFTGAVVSYVDEVKRDVLGVTAERVVSSDCAEQMATGVRRLLGVEWALSTTGVAGPDEQEGQAVGTVYVGIASPQRVRSVRLALEGGRPEIRRAVCAAALELLLQEVTHG
jgi:PncC family amidohydrolase